MQVNLYGQDGSVKGKVSLPAAFQEPYRPDLIRKAVNAARANRRQAYGSDPDAGKRQVTTPTRPGQGMARVPRGVGTNVGGFSPSTRGGRRAHPPQAAKDWSEKVNKKERAKALRSALAATATLELVQRRGHRFQDGLTVPVVLERGAEGIAKTQQLLELLGKLGLASDVERASAGTHQRAGRGKLRGRRVRTPRSLLLVAPHGSAVQKAAQNLPGVDVASPEQLNAELVAPGGDAGRLVVLTEGGLARLLELMP